MFVVGLVVTLLLRFYSASAQESAECVCVPYYQCRPNGTIITDGEGLLNERLGSSCQNCECTNLDVCCAIPKPEALLPRKPNTTESQCGYINPDGIGFKVGVEGPEALFGEFPWMVQIFEDGLYRCGGSLIHESVILTAAHCVKQANSTYSIRAGEWDTSNTNEVLQHQDQTVASIKLHENFNPKNYRNDVALVFLSKPLDLKPHINLVCLVPEVGIPANNTRCIATGWGNSKYGPEQNGSKILKKVDLPLLESSNCQTLFRNTRLGAYFLFHETFICAGAEKDKDTCTGDGGGPLFCPIEGQEDRYQQVGITAWGLDCNDDKVPGAYANIAFLRKWIDKQMKDKNLEIGPYQYA